MAPWEDAQANPFGEPTPKERGRSAQRVEAGAEQAGWWHRVAGWIVDAGAAGAIGAGAAAWAASAAWSDDDAQALGVGTGFLAWLLNVVVLVSITNGQSLGKLIGGMRIVRDDGGPVSAWLGFRRDVLLRLLYFIPLFFILDSVWPASSDGQTLRDKLTRTRVFRTSAYGRRAAALVMAVVAATVALSAAVDATPDRWGEEAQDYGPEARKEYLIVCRRDSGFTTSECGCSYAFLSKRLSYTQFRRAVYEGTPDPSARTDRIWERMLDRCLQRSVPTDEPPRLRA